MLNLDDIILYDPINNVMNEGEYFGSIVLKFKGNQGAIILSDNVDLSSNVGFTFDQAIKIGFKIQDNKKVAYLQKIQNQIINDFDIVEYCIKVSDSLMDEYDKRYWSSTLPSTITMVHTAGLYLKDPQYEINHLDFFENEILRNPLALINRGVIIADRITINSETSMVFYDSLIIGRDENNILKTSFEDFIFVEKEILEYIIILGRDELKS
ncbi:MAG: hypothetical protein ACTSUL_07505 [Promethearchaeota archaeon]